MIHSESAEDLRDSCLAVDPLAGFEPLTHRDQYVLGQMVHVSSRLISLLSVKQNIVNS